MPILSKLNRVQIIILLYWLSFTSVSFALTKIEINLKHVNSIDGWEDVTSTFKILTNGNEWQLKAWGKRTKAILR